MSGKGFTYKGQSINEMTQDEFADMMYDIGNNHNLLLERYQNTCRNLKDIVERVSVTMELEGIILSQEFKDKLLKDLIAMESDGETGTS